MDTHPLLDGQKGLDQQGLDYQLPYQPKSEQTAIIEPPPLLPEEKGIFRLPDELLLDILELATISLSNFHHRRPRKNVTEICKLCFAPSIVCCRFNRLVTPLLYGSLELFIIPEGDDRDRSLTSFRNLHRTLTKNPSLHQHTHTLDINLGRENYDKGTIDMFTDLAVLFLNVKCLTLTYMFYNVSEGLQVFLAAMRHMTKLERLILPANIHLRRGVEDLGDIFQALNPLQHLRELIYDRGPGHLAQSKFSHSRSMKKIVLKPVTGSAADLHLFLTWPTCLESFRIALTGIEQSPAPIALSTISSSLSPHKKTLHTLDIGYLHVQGLEGFDLTEFENLENLKLSAWTMGAGPSNGEMLLAPRLRTFIWIFTIRGRPVMRKTKFQFKESHEVWLREFIRVAVHARSSLKQILISLHGIEDIWEQNGLPEVYPWDCIKRVREETKGSGIRIAWSKPKMESVEFYQRLDEERRNLQRVDVVSDVHPMGGGDGEAT